MASYLGNRFDTSLIFNRSSTYEGKELIVEYVCNLVRYRLWKSVNPRSVSQQVRDDYNEVMDWLEGVADNTIHPELPHISNPEVLRTDQPIYGGDNEPKNFLV